MKFLVIGGTMFLGRWFVEAALQAGHEVTLFHRGRHGAELFPKVERILGDRDQQLDLLRHGHWDAVVDTCGYLPKVVRKSVQALKERAGSYLFVSSVSAYADEATPNQTEDAPLATTDEPDSEDIAAHYGALKVLCEKVVEEGFGDCALNIRPTLIVGPHDPTDRFTYWPVRFHRGGRIVVPDRFEQPVQIIDVRDLAEWMVRLLEQRIGGAFTAAGPEKPLTMAGVFEACERVCGQNAQLVPIPESFLVGQSVGPWMDLPMWLTEESRSDGMMQASIDKALAHGLSFRDLDATVRDTLEWHERDAKDRPKRAGLTPEREAEVLAAWDERSL